MSSCLEDSCSICCSDFNGSDHQAVALSCSHRFCASCLTKLRSSDSHTCPVCQKDWKHLQLNLTVQNEMVKINATNDETPTVVQTDATSNKRSFNSQIGTVVSEIDEAGVNIDITRAVVPADTKSDEQDCDLKAGVEKEVNALCHDHALPFWFWCNECKEFCCRKCVATKQNDCKLFDIEEMLPDIKSYFKSQIETVVSEVQNNAEDLNTALTQATDMLSSVTKHIDALLKHQLDLTAYVNIDALLKHQLDLTAYVKVLQEMVSKRRQDVTAVKKYCSVIKEKKKVTEIPVLQKSLKVLKELRQHGVMPMLPSLTAVESDTTCTCKAEASHNAGSSMEAVTARSAALLKDGETWTVNDSNWQAAIMALADRQPERLILRVAGQSLPETFKEDAVATIVAAARGCEVWMDFFDTFYCPNDQNTDRKLLEHVLANKSLRLTRFYGHLNAAGVARLPQSVKFLGLSIGSAWDASAVSGISAYGLWQLDVAVSTSVAPQHLWRLPAAKIHNVHFYGISDSQVHFIRPVLYAIALINIRIQCQLDSLCFPKCQLSAGGARRLAQELRGVLISTVYVDSGGLWKPGGGREASCL